MGVGQAMESRLQHVRRVLGGSKDSSVGVHTSGLEPHRLTRRRIRWPTATWSNSGFKQRQAATRPGVRAGGQPNEGVEPGLSRLVAVRNSRCIRLGCRRERGARLDGVNQRRGSPTAERSIRCKESLSPNRLWRLRSVGASALTLRCPVHRQLVLSCPCPLRLTDAASQSHDRATGGRQGWFWPCQGVAAYQTAQRGSPEVGHDPRPGHSPTTATADVAASRAWFSWHHSLHQLMRILMESSDENDGHD